jgi:hypothetical protein
VRVRYFYPEALIQSEALTKVCRPQANLLEDAPQRLPVLPADHPDVRTCTKGYTHSTGSRQVSSTEHSHGPSWSYRGEGEREGGELSYRHQSHHAGADPAVRWSSSRSGCRCYRRLARSGLRVKNAAQAHAVKSSTGRGPQARYCPHVVKPSAVLTFDVLVGRIVLVRQRLDQQLAPGGHHADPACQQSKHGKWAKLLYRVSG